MSSGPGTVGNPGDAANVFQEARKTAPQQVFLAASAAARAAAVTLPVQLARASRIRANMRKANR